MKLYKRIVAGALSIAFSASLISLPAAAAVTPVFWDGSRALAGGHTYYIGNDTAVNGDFTLPADSTMIISPGANLVIPAGSSLKIEGSVNVSRGAQMLAMGKLSTDAASHFTVKGELITGKSSDTDFGGNVLFDNGAYVSLFGETELLHSAQLYSYASGVTIDGSLISAGYAEFRNTLRLYSNTQINAGATLKCDGIFSVEESGNVANSGEMILGEEAYYSLSGGFANIGGGFVTDNRNKYPGEAYHSDNISLYTTDAIKGIDVSYYQDKYIDWDKVAASGVKFAMVRSSYGYISEDSPPTADKYFHQNVTGAIKAGLDVGVYHYCYAETVQGARDEAKFVLSLIKGYDISYPIVIDIEDDWYIRNGYTRAQLTAITEAFCDEIRDAGYLPMVYSYANWLKNQLNMEYLDEYAVWVAHVGVDKPSFSGRYYIWQHSWEENIPGIVDKNGKLLDVDGDYSYVDFGAYIRNNHLNGY